MPNIQGQKKWSSVRLLETHELARGGVNGNLNEQAQALADRTEFLNQEKANKSEIVQGVFEFGTYAEFNAAKATLPQNCTVVIGEENTGSGTWGIGNNVWNGNSLTKSTFDPVIKSNNYTDSKSIVKPPMNPVVNLNDVGYGVNHFGDNSIITLANNFPLAGQPAIVRTFKSDASQVKYQVATYPFFRPPRVFERSFTGTWELWVEKVRRPEIDAALLSIQETKTDISKLDQSVFSIGKNKIDKTKIVAGEYISPSNMKIGTAAAYRRSDFIPVVEGTDYRLSGASISTAAIGWFDSNDKNATALLVTQTSQVKAPVGAKFAVVNISHNSTSDFDDTVMLEIGTVATAYEPFFKKIELNKIANKEEILLQEQVLEPYSFNKINPSEINFNRRYSTGSKGFVTDKLLIAHTNFIPVKEGEWYTVSGNGLFGSTWSQHQGGYFSSNNLSNAIDNITFTSPVSGGGGCFKVPTGLGITHVVISVKKTSENILDGVVQLEEGEMPTEYQPYLLKNFIRTDLLRQSSNSGTGSTQGFNDAAWYKYVKADGGKIFQDKLPKFRKAMLLKNEDVVVVNTGTSLTARTSEHCTLRSDAAFRPPMMHSNAFCSHIWDALKWDGQQYRRYDSAYFTETGTFATSSNLDEWDDGPYRDGLTRYSTIDNASVQFVIPENAWQFNFIYRTDSLGCNARINIAEGAGKVQVFDEATQEWIEANNYSFTQLEATPVARTIAVPAVISETISNQSLTSKGNTTYQKRLKMRCRGDNGSFDSLSSAKTVSISRIGGGIRFMYWGVEWSPRQYMITYINAARGSHNTNATGTSGLPRFQDNEIWSFKPTLILSELGIHNDGAAAAGVYPVGQWRQLAKHYVTNTNFELSMYSRAAHFGLNPEYCFFTASISWNFNGINEDGSLKYSLQSSSTIGPARAMSALDKYQEATEYLNSVGVPCIDAARQWVEAGFGIFGDLKSATLGSGKNGATFTNEGSHWNDTGSRIIAKAVLPILG